MVFPLLYHPMLVYYLHDCVNPQSVSNCIAFVAYIQLDKLTGSSSITAVFIFAEYKALLLCHACVNKDFLQHVILGY